MSSSGIKKLRTSQDRVTDVLREQEQEFIQNLKSLGTEKGGFGLVGLGGTTSGSPIPAGNYLNTAGGVMMGPIAYNPSTVSIVTNAINIGLSSEKSSTYVILDSATTDLITITGAQFSGQDLILQGKTGSTITVKNSGNIVTSDGADYDIVGLALVRLIYDEASTKWRIYSTVGSGGAGGWVGTAASDLNMATFDIDMNGNILHFDVDKDTYMESSTDDNLQIFAGGSVRLSVSNTGTLFSSDVTLLGTFADLNISSNNINFLTNQSISATAAGITYNVDATHDHFFTTTGGGTALQIGATNTYHSNHVLPSITNTYDLGSSTFEWKDIRIDGIAYIDKLDNISADIVVSADLDFDTGKYPDLADTSTSVSGTGIQLPLNGSSNAACEGFVIIKVNGAPKKIPYYS
jgi:hypothetical protein